MRIETLQEIVAEQVRNAAMYGLNARDDLGSLPPQSKYLDLCALRIIEAIQCFEGGKDDYAI